MGSSSSTDIFELDHKVTIDIICRNYPNIPDLGKLEEMMIENKHSSHFFRLLDRDWDAVNLLVIKHFGIPGDTKDFRLDGGCGELVTAHTPKGIRRRIHAFIALSEEEKIKDYLYSLESEKIKHIYNILGEYLYVNFNSRFPEIIENYICEKSLITPVTFHLVAHCDIPRMIEEKRFARSCGIYHQLEGADKKMYKRVYCIKCEE